MRELATGCDVVFHLAALIAIPYSYRAVASYLAANVQGTFNMLEACRAGGVGRLVHTSTSEVYGTAQYVPIDERHPLHAQSPYAATKIAADQLAGSYHATYNLPVVTVRPFNNFGPRQSARAVIPSIISQALASGRVELGSLDPVRDFLFVTDTARGYLAAASAEGACGQVYNLGTGRGVSIAQVVELVGQIIGRPLNVDCSAQRQRPAASEVQRLICSAEKAAAELGWRPEASLEEGLERTVRWIGANLELFRPGQYAT
jgi:dTDP-glucose 4,6-dehydratase